MDELFFRVTCWIAVTPSRSIRLDSEPTMIRDEAEKWQVAMKKHPQHQSSHIESRTVKTGWQKQTDEEWFAVLSQAVANLR